MQKLWCIPLLFLAFLSCFSERGEKSENLNDEGRLALEENGFSTLDTLKGLEISLFPSTFETGELDKTVRSVFQNNTEYQLSLGSEFAVEKWNGDGWVLLPFVVDFVFTEPLYILPPKGGFDEVEYCLSKCLADGLKDKGKYRLVIGVGLSHELEAKFKVFGEFTVE